MNRLQKWWFGKTGKEILPLDGAYEVKNLGNLIIPEKLKDSNAFMLANSVSEIFFPIDFYADRISKLRFYIANKKGREIRNSELNRFVSDSINPLFTFSDLVYQYVFSLLSDGNAINYVTVPSIYKKVSVSTIERWDVLIPDQVAIDEYSNVSYLDISEWNELIRRASYNYFSGARKDLDIDRLFIQNYGVKRRDTSNVLAASPLWNANKSIDTLLSVYSARYNVYSNNGMAGLLSKKTSGSNAGLEAALSSMDGSSRDDIINDINERHGLVGKKNIWGISSIPVEFIKTLASIKDLMPFDETLEDSIKIASVFQIPPVLVPRKDQSTYDNQANAEKNIWENGLLATAKTVCENLTKMFTIDKAGYQITFDPSTVSALMENQTEVQTLISKKLENIEKIKQLNPEIDINSQIEEIYNSYETE